MSLFTVPVTNIPQKFAISLAGKEYIMSCRWNDADEAGWFLDIFDGLTETPLASNIPLITGKDCLSGLEYLGVQGQLFVLTDGDQFAVPTYKNLGIESNLYFLTEVPDGG